MEQPKTLQDSDNERQFPDSFETAYAALNTLSPPSPVLSMTADEFSDLLTTEDIPILFACPSDESLTLENALNSSNIRESQAIVEGPGEDGLDGLGALVAGQSTGTFGPLFRTPPLMSIHYSQSSNLARLSKSTARSPGDARIAEEPDSSVPQSSPLADGPPRSQSISSLRSMLGFTKKSQLSRLTKHKQALSESKISRHLGSAHHRTVTVDNTSPQVTLSAMSRLGLSPPFLSNDSIASCPVTPVTRSGSMSPLQSHPSLSIPGMVDSYTDGVPGAQFAMFCDPAFLTSMSSTRSVPCTPLHQTSFGFHESHLSKIAPSILSDSPSAQASLYASSSNSSMVQAQTVPQHLSWLNQMTVELLIDQEGFRTIVPTFRFVSYSQRSRAFSHVSPGTEVYHDSADFMPVTRQCFHFHYKPFDSGNPTLRRVMVNGDESRDYISRQASLTLKTNGVYVVRGSEQANFSTANQDAFGSHSNPAEAAKLRWRMEYMISDRRLDTTGRFIEGEKTFTPLLFSCSPMLLHHLQGKKIRLMHVVKKTVVPSLVAQKMDLQFPVLAAHSTSSGASEALQSPIASPTKVNIRGDENRHLAQPFALELHKVAYSQTDSDSSRSPSTRPLLPTSPQPSSKPFFFNDGMRKISHGSDQTRTWAEPVREVDTMTDGLPARATRRASYAGEYDVAGFISSNAPAVPPLPRTCNTLGESTNRDPTTPTKNHKGDLDRPIIPRAKLLELMADNERKATPSPPVVNDGIQPLPHPKRVIAPVPKGQPI